MKVYIVFCSYDPRYESYSPYDAAKQVAGVFSTYEAAEEFRVGKGFIEPVVEYEVSDASIKSNEERCMLIEMFGVVDENGLKSFEDIITFKIADEYTCRAYTGLLSQHTYLKHGIYHIKNYHIIPVEAWDEEKYKAKYTKLLKAQAELATKMLAEGAGWSETETAIRKLDAEGI